MDCKIKLFLLVHVMLFTVCGYGQKEILLYDGKLQQDMENFPLAERARKDSITGEIITIRNVSIPTLTVYEPAKGKRKGTALIICPGGGFSGLAWQTEGTPTANWCIEHGITAFILKYRLIPYPDPAFDSLRGNERDSIMKKYVTMSVADGGEAVKYVRAHAAEYGIDPGKIGIVGYSAGGTVTGSVAQTYSKDSRPDFVAPIYAYVKAMIGDKVPDDAPPMFLAWASDDPIASGNPDLYKKWRVAGKSIEMHAFSSGGHGFSVTKHNKPSDEWTELFIAWMKSQGFLTE